MSGGRDLQFQELSSPMQCLHTRSCYNHMLVDLLCTCMYNSNYITKGHKRVERIYPAAEVQSDLW